MAIYYVNTKAQAKSGDHEVHRADCRYVPKITNRLSLGDHPNCHSALRAARSYFATADGCYYCCRKCHSS